MSTLCSGSVLQIQLVHLFHAIILLLMYPKVAELESLGGQCMVLCSYDGMLYHNESAICEKLIADKDLISSFGSLLHCKFTILGFSSTYFKISHFVIHGFLLHVILLL